LDEEARKALGVSQVVKVPDPTPQVALPLGLLWLAGICLRLPVLAIPPVIPLIHRDLQLSELEVAALTSLPVLVLATAVLLGSWVIARAGARWAVVSGLCLTALVSGLRGVGPSKAGLFGMTVLTGVGIAIFQPALPSLVSVWLPTRVGLATAVYVNGLLVGEALAAGITLPVILPLVGGRWTWSLGAWALPILLTAGLLAWLTRQLPDAVGSPQVRWWPDWGAPRTWRLGLLLGGNSAVYFGANAFFPDYLHAVGRPALTAAALAAFNAAQLPASLWVMAGAVRLVGRRGPFLAMGLAMLVGLGMVLSLGGWGVALGAALLGFTCGGSLALCSALPPLVADPAEVHRVAAGMFLIGYLYSFGVPLVGGAVWDRTHVPATAFLPVALGALTLLVATVRWPERARS
jgi:MFS transporter, CP family, cyanate transporter